MFSFQRLFISLLGKLYRNAAVIRMLCPKYAATYIFPDFMRIYPGSIIGAKPAAAISRANPTAEISNVR
jgi:hypothetical protein